MAGQELSRIVVVTHNGLLPSQGGRRLGYRVGGFFVPVGTSELISLKKPKPKEPEINFFDLPEALVGSFRAQCSQCGSINTASFVKKVDTGHGTMDYKEVVRCHNCGCLMQPARRRGLWEDWD